MKCTVVDFSKDSTVYNVTGATRAELDNRLNLFFLSQKLTLANEKPDEKVYQRGSKVLRILLGVFVKYFKIVVTIRGNDDLFSVRLHRDMNFYMSGGAIGLVKARKEFERINEEFKSYFNN